MKTLARCIAILIITTVFASSASACGFLNLFSSKKSHHPAPQKQAKVYSDN